MPLTVLPDAERLALGYLHTHSDVTGLIGQRAYWTIPATPTFPLVRVQRVGGVPVRPGWLDGARLQVDVYGSDHDSTWQVAETVRAALHQGSQSSHSLGVWTGTDDDMGLAWLPDDAYGRPRLVFGVTVWTHPLP